MTSALEGIVLDGLSLNASPGSSGAYSAAVLALTPSLYWRLGEPSGTTANDASGNARTGTYAVGCTLAQPGLLMGDSDTSVAFDATANAKVTSSYNPFTGSLTFFGWANVTNFSTAVDVFGGGVGAGGATGPLLRLAVTTGVPTWFTDAGAAAVTWTAGDFPSGQTVFWALTYVNATKTSELFINGVSKGTKVSANAFNATTGNFGLGQFGGTGSWRGIQDDAAIVPSILSPAQITALYTAGATFPSAFRLQGYDVTPPAKRQEWAQGADMDGAGLVRVPLFENREIMLRLRVDKQSTMDLALAQIATLSKKLQEAEQQPDGLALVWTPAGSANSLTFYVLSGTIEGMPIDLSGDDAGWFLKAPVITVKLICAPLGDGTPITSSTTSSATPFVSHLISGVPGDAPAKGRLLITDAASQDRRYVEWGLENRWYNAATSLLVDSDDMVTSGYTGFQTTRAGAYDPNASGNSIVRGTLTTIPLAMCSSGTLSHVGTYRVKARIWAGGTIGTQYVRLAWQEGDGPYRSNAYAVPPVAGTFSEVDLGLITIPPKQLGTQRWQGRVESYTTGTPGTDFLEVDYMTLIPAGEGYGKARGEIVADTPTVMSARDEFDHAAGNLTGKVAPVGGAWTATGDTDDYTIDTTNHRAKRDALGDTTNIGRDVVAGSAMTTMAVQVTTGGISLDGWNGLLARHTDANNKLKVLIRGFAVGYPVGIAVVKRKASSETTISPGDGFFSAIYGSIAAGYYALPTAGVQSNSPQIQMRIEVLTDGSWYLWAAPLGSPLVFIDAGQDVDLATGGTLASGKAGIYDEATGSVGRFYDNFSAWVPTPPTVIYSGRVGEIRYDGTKRQDSTGVYYGDMPSYRGSKFFVPCAGDEARTTRIYVKAHRTDIETVASTNVTDNLTIQTVITPRYIVVPF